MSDNNNFEIIIIGGSYSGLSAAMSLGRALRNVLIIDSERPRNKQTPYSHNFLTQDGRTPMQIATLAKRASQSIQNRKILQWISCKGSKNRERI
jgi:thioredoxin reductase